MSDTIHILESNLIMYSDLSEQMGPVRTRRLMLNEGYSLSEVLEIERAYYDTPRGVTSRTMLERALSQL